MIRKFAITSDDFEFGIRLVPSYYYYSTIIKQKARSRGIEYIKLESIAKKVSDGEHSHIKRNSVGGIRYLYGRNIKEGVVNYDIISDDSFISEKDYKKFTRCHIKENDILISIYGTIGKSAVYKSEYIGIAGIPRHISSITLKDKSPLTPEFITVFFRSKIGKWQLDNLTTGNIQQLLSLKNIKKIDLPVPNPEFIKKITDLEQQAIDKEILALSLIEKARVLFFKKLGVDFEKVERSISFSVNLSDFVNEDLWTPAFSNPSYVGKLNLIKMKWPTVPLKEIAQLKKGDEVGSDNYIKYIDKKDGDVPFIRTSDIVNYEVDQFSDFFIPEETYKELAQDLKPNDVLFTKDGKIGMTGMITKSDKAIIASGFIRLRLKTEAKKYNLTPEFLFIALSTNEVGFIQAIRRTVVASTIPHLREERFKEIEIPVIDQPSIYEISLLVKQAFELKDERKTIIKNVAKEIDNYFAHFEDKASSDCD